MNSSCFILGWNLVYILVAHSFRFLTFPLHCRTLNFALLKVFVGNRIKCNFDTTKVEATVSQPLCRIYIVDSPDLSECDGLWPHSRHRGWRLEDKTQTLDRDMSKYLVLSGNLESEYTRLLLLPARSLDKFDTPTSHLSNIRTRWKQDLFQTGEKCKQRNIFLYLHGGLCLWCGDVENGEPFINVIKVRR